MHIQNATLAGGVAIGTAANLMVQPFGAMLVGSAAGILSVVGFQYIQVNIRYLFVFAPQLITGKFSLRSSLSK